MSATPRPPSYRGQTFRDSLSVSLTVGSYGAAFGAASIAAGFSVVQTSLLSLLTFSGASQFAVIGVIGAGGSAISAIATATLLGFRNGLYGLRMAPLLKVRGLSRVLAAHVTIDESTGVALSQESRGEEAMRSGFWLTGIGVFIFWNLFTLAGAFGAQAMGNPAAWGLDAAVPAAFLGLVWPRLVTNTDRFISLAAVALALVLIPISPSGRKIQYPMNKLWWGVMGTSAAVFALKYLGQSIPENYLSHPKFKSINGYIPIVLLSALIGVQTFSEKTKLMIDHRALGLGVALLALMLRAPFPIVVISAAASSALLYHFT